jgi:hypothetical protein
LPSASARHDLFFRGKGRLEINGREKPVKERFKL